MDKLQLKGLTKKLRRTVTVVDNLDLTLRAGEFVSLLGAVRLRQDHDVADDRGLCDADSGHGGNGRPADVVGQRPRCRRSGGGCR